MRKRVAALLGIAVFVAAIAVILGHGDELVDHVPLPYQIVSGVLGLAIGLYSVVRLNDRLRQQGWRGYAAVLVLPILTTVSATYCGRLVYEAIGFAGTTPTEAIVDAPIIDMSSGKSGPHAIVTIGSGSRKIWVSVSHQLYGRLDAYRHPGRDCLALTVQIGRYGIRRVILPGLLAPAVDVDRLKACPKPVPSPTYDLDLE